MKKIKLHLRINPIIIREFRGHMSGPRAFGVLTGYLLGLGLTAYALYRIIIAAASNGMQYGGSPQSAMVGQMLFISLAFLEMACVCFITPALTAGTISSEYEQRTYDALMSTPLQPLSILWGKMIPALSYIFLLILAAIPMFSIVFLFGGVMVGDILRALGLLVLTSVMLGMIGIFFSALARRTGRAAVWSYVVVALLLFGTIFAWMGWSAIGGQNGYMIKMAVSSSRLGGGGGGIQPVIAPRALLYLNPFSALTSATMTPDMSQNIYMLGSSIGMLFSLTGGQEAVGILPTGGYASRPLWHYTACIYLVLIAVLYLVTSHLVRPVRRWRVNWETLIGLLVVVALLGGSYWFIFRPGSEQLGTGGFGTFPLEPTPAPAIPLPAKPVIIDIKPVVPGGVIEAPAPAPDSTPTPLPTPTAVPNPLSAQPSGEISAPNNLPPSQPALARSFFWVGPAAAPVNLSSLPPTLAPALDDPSSSQLFLHLLRSGAERVPATGQRAEVQPIPAAGAGAWVTELEG